MLATLGVTTYNAAGTVRSAIESVLAQDWEQFEVIVVDDASSDETRDILNEYERNDPRLRVLANERNLGVAASRNVIISEARGEFVAFFDDDDVSAPDRVRRQIERLVTYEAEFGEGAPVICHTARYQNYPDGSTRIERTMGENEGRRAPSGLPVVERTLMGTPLDGAYGSCGCGSLLARTDTVRAFGAFDPAFRRCEDSELYIRMATKGAHFVGIGEPLVTQAMTQTSDKSLDSIRRYQIALIEKHRDVFPTDRDYRHSRDWIDMKFSLHGGRRAELIRRLAWLGLRFPIRTARRLMIARWNVEGNRAFRRFYADRQSPSALPPP